MEDASSLIDGFGGDGGTAFFGVYDGHGGRSVADFLRERLHEVCAKEIEEAGDRGVEECLKSAFLLTGGFFAVGTRNSAPLLVLLPSGHRTKLLLVTLTRY